MEQNGENIHLARKLTPVNVWALALGCIIGWGAFFMPGTTFLNKGGPLGTALGMFIAAVIMSVIAVNYHFLISRYPVAGGEYTYTKAAFGSRHAFFCSWFLGLSYLMIIPLNATALPLLGRAMFGSFFQVGFHYTVAGYDVYCGEILLAVAALALFAFISIRGVRFAGAFQAVLVFSLVGSVLLIVIAAALNPTVSWKNLLPAFRPGIPPAAGVLAIVAVAPWAFVGFDTIPQAAEEFNFSPRKTRVIMILSIVSGALIYVTLNTVAALVVPSGYANWAEYIDMLPGLDGLDGMPVFFASHQLLGSVGLVFIGIAVLAAILSGLMGFYMATSRLLYSIAKEGSLPAWFARLHPRYRTPHLVIVFIMLICLPAPFFGRAALGWIVDMSSIGAAIGYGYTSAAAVKIAVAEKRPWMVVTGVLGVFFSVVFALLLLVPIPQFNCSLGKESYICLIVWSVLGLLFYLHQRKARQTR